ncbi:MAG: hypothetical protein OEM97_00525 [Acidimicrobiia bacterium]|nr:hypothetical protein [Acidimicrobiia bacterium]
MSLWDTLKSLIAREAADVKEGLDGLRDKLDAELTKKEREMEASPAERIEMLQDDMSTENVFDRIEADIDSRLSDDDGQNEPDDQVS